MRDAIQNLIPVSTTTCGVNAEETRKLLVKFGKKGGHLQVFEGDNEKEVALVELFCLIQNILLSSYQLPLLVSAQHEQETRKRTAFGEIFGSIQNQ